MPIVRDILYGAAQRGANLSAMCRKLSLPVPDLSQSDRVVDFEKAYSAWDVAISATDDAMLGLHLGSTTTPSILGIVGHLMQSCASLDEAFRQVCAYGAVATDMFKYAMIKRGDQTVLQFTPAAAWMRVSPKTARQAVDQAMAGCLNVFFLLSGRHIPPQSTTFTMSRPAQPDHYTQVFGEKVQYGSKANTLTFAHHDLLLPLHQHDRSLFATFESLAKKQLRGRRARRTFRDDVEHCMRFEFAAQVPSLEVIATHMNMSTRTFQRRLSDEQINYRDLYDQVSGEIALSLIASNDISIADISRIMGYSEPSSFRRAVKRWTKSTPGNLKHHNKKQ